MGGALSFFFKIRKRGDEGGEEEDVEVSCLITVVGTTFLAACRYSCGSREQVHTASCAPDKADNEKHTQSLGQA